MDHGFMYIFQKRNVKKSLENIFKGLSILESIRILALNYHTLDPNCIW
jgi:hypothetical protein